MNKIFKKVVVSCIILVLLVSTALWAGTVLAEPAPKTAAVVGQPQAIEGTLVELDDIALIVRDLQAAIWLREQMKSGKQEVMQFNDGTKLELDVPPAVLSQLDLRIASLSGLLKAKVGALK